LNVRLLAGTLVALAAVVPAAWFWHARQVRANADGLLARAGQLEQQGDHPAAVAALQRYVQLRPDDVAQRVRLAELFGGSAATRDEKRQALKLYALAQGLAPDKLDVRRRRIELLLELGYLPQASGQAEALLAEQGQSRDPVALRVRALALYYLRQFGGRVEAGDLSEALFRAVEQAPHDVELAHALAAFLRGQLAEVADSGGERGRQLARQADEVMDRLVADSPDRAIALVARHRYRRDYQLPGSGDDLRQALALDDQQHLPEVRLAAGQEALAQKQPRKAAEFFTAAIEAGLANRAAMETLEQSHLGLGRAHLAVGSTEEALNAWQMGLKTADPSSIELNFEIAQALIALDRLDDADKHLDKLEQEISMRARYLMPRPLSRLEQPVSALRAEWRFARKEYAEAAGLLRQLLVNRHSTPQIDEQQRHRLQLRLGMCYAQLKQWDRAASVFQQASDAQPNLPQPLVAAADAWERGGNLVSAIACYEKALGLPGVAPDAWASLAHVRFRNELQIPPAQRRWADFERALAAARELLPQDGAVLLLAAEYAALRNRPHEAARLLDQISQNTATPVKLREEVVLAYERMGRPSQADEALRRWEDLHGASVLTSLVHARLLLARRRAGDARRALEAALVKAPRAERAEVEFQLALLDVETGNRQQARRQLARLAKEHPDDLRFVQFLAELALEGRDAEQLEHSVRHLRRLEGVDGTLWRFFEAQRLALLASGPRDDGLVNAQALQEQIERIRPSWSAAYLLKGHLARQRNQIDEAIAAYQAAIEMGEDRLRVFEHLVDLLYGQHRFEEADQVLELLRGRNQLSPRLAELGIATSVRLDESQRAVALAQAQVRDKPRDAIARLWLAQALEADGQSDSAQEQLIEATRLAPHDARPWSALLRYYVRAKRPADARRTLAEMTRRIKISAEQRPFVLAQAHEIVGDRKAAATLYRQAVQASPKQAVVWQRAAAFFFETDATEAERCLRQVLLLKPDSGLARRMLATLVAARGGEENLSDAIQLLERVGLPSREQAANDQLKARLLLARGGGAERLEGQRTLEQLVRRSDESQTADRLLLAQLYEARGWTSAAEEQISLAASHDGSPKTLAAYVDFLLRNERYGEASRWLDELESKAPSSRHLLTLSLRARWLAARGRQSEIEPLVQPFVESGLSQPADAKAKARLLIDVARLYASVQLDGAVEQAYRRAAALDSLGARGWATWLAHSGRVAEAVAVCVDLVRADESAAAAATLAHVLARGAASAEHQAVAEGILKESLQRHPRDIDLLVAVGTLRLLEGRRGEAAALFRRALKLDAGHVVAMNNLAMVLAEEPDQQAEAIQHLDRAIALSGRNSELLDSKGWVLLQQDQAREAEKLFREAAELRPRDPRVQFHLALACWRQGRRSEAKNWLEQARNGNLPADILSPSERAQLSQLEEELEG
jgi:tetratricopeptide (TPR) repeat protein